jgi:hypothetical protein
VRFNGLRDQREHSHIALVNNPLLLLGESCVQWQAVEQLVQDQELDAQRKIFNPLQLTRGQRDPVRLEHEAQDLHRQLRDPAVFDAQVVRYRTSPGSANQNVLRQLDRLLHQGMIGCSAPCLSRGSTQSSGHGAAPERLAWLLPIVAAFGKVTSMLRLPIALSGFQL